MKLTFFSNYFNHHQEALCNELHKLLGDGFTFVETEEIEEFRSKMGWGREAIPAYVLKSHTSQENLEKAYELGESSDVVIMGTAPEDMIEKRLEENKLTFRYSERPLKEGRVKIDIHSAEGSPFYLDPDAQLIFSPSENKVAIAKVDARKVLGWEDGFLSFVNASFPEIVSALERKFNVSITFNADKMHRGNTLNVRFNPDDSLEDALEVLTLLLPGSRYKKVGNRIFYQF